MRVPFTFTFAFAFCGCAPTAELVIRNAVIVPSARPVSSMAIVGGKIAALGDETATARFVGRRTRVLDAAGGTAIVALTDAHGHLHELGQSRARVDLTGCTSSADCAARIGQQLATSPVKGWILGRGWDQNLFADRTFPRHEALDALKTDRPIWLRRVDGHAGWASAQALSRAGITKDTLDPEGGRILRDEHGEATGVLVDKAMAIVDAHVPAPTVAEREAAILRGQAVALSFGLTSVHEMGIDDDTADAYRNLERDGKLRLRIVGYATGSLDSMRARAATEPAPWGPRFSLRGIKLFSDGALGSRGASLLAPYSDEPSHQGLSRLDRNALEALTRSALERGWQLAVHAIGDAANRAVLDAFAHAGCTRMRGHRFRIEHAQVLSPTDLTRFAELGVIASMQPIHAPSDAPWAQSRLGAERIQGAYAWRTLLDHGARLAFGSDFPVESPDPRAGLHAAVTRPGREQLTLDQAIDGFTRGAAFAAFAEGARGEAKVGYAGDVTLFDRDLSRDPSGVRDAQVRFTIIAGEIVYPAR